MKAMLASALGATRKVNGTKVPSVIIQRNGFLDRLKTIWVQNARVLIICGDPGNFKKNDDLCNDLRESFGMSGLSVFVGKNDRYSRVSQGRNRGLC